MKSGKFWENYQPSSKKKKPTRPDKLYLPQNGGDIFKEVIYNPVDVSKHMTLSAQLFIDAFVFTVLEGKKLDVLLN